MMTRQNASSFRDTKCFIISWYKMLHHFVIQNASSFRDTKCFIISWCLMPNGCQNKCEGQFTKNLPSHGSFISEISTKLSTNKRNRLVTGFNNNQKSLKKNKFIVSSCLSLSTKRCPVLTHGVFDKLRLTIHWLRSFLQVSADNHSLSPSHEVWYY